MYVTPGASIASTCSSLLRVAEVSNSARRRRASRRRSNDDLVRQTRRQVLLRRTRSAADRHVLVAGSCPGLLEGRLDFIRDKVEDDTALQLPGSRAWWVRTETGLWLGGFSPLRPFQESSTTVRPAPGHVWP